MYTIETELMLDMVVFRITGKILLPNAIQFLEEISTIFNGTKVYEGCLDLSKVEKMDNSGLGALVSLSDKFIKQGRYISLYNPTPEIQQLIKSVGIEKFFTIYDNEQELKNHSLHEGA